MPVKGPELFDLTGRVAVVTGGSSGIGRSLGEALAACGARIVYVARRADRVREAADAIGGAAVVADVAERERAREIADEVARPFGWPDIVVNAAGLNVRARAEEVTPGNWDTVMAIQLAAPLFFTQPFVPAMREKGWGRVVNIGSLSTARALPSTTAYATAKSGIAGLTRAMAMDWAPWGITANVLCPGYFETELTAPVVADTARWQALADSTMIGRNGRLEDLHGACIFLASEASAYVTGQTLFVDGGFTAR